MKLLKEALALLAVGAVAVGAVVVLLRLEPWVSDRERDQDWVRGYVAWTGQVDGVTTAGTPLRPCASWLDEAAGEPPSPRTREARSVALEACRALTRSALTDEDWERWHDEGARVVSVLLDGLEADAATRSMPVLAAPVASSAGDRRPSVFCWPDDEWEALAEEYRLLVRDEFWLAGLADPLRARIHLAPWVCTSLRRFFESTYTPFGNEQSFELAEALVVLAHEAEHLRSPDASEAEVECVALQRVRTLVLEARRSPTYAEEMAGLAWDAGYPLQYEEYRTEKCADGGPLDLHPASDTWP